MAAGKNRCLIVTIGSTKGGAGKSTIAGNLAVAAGVRGMKVLLVDADTQASSMSFRALREDNLIQAIAITTPKLHQDVPGFAENYDLVLIDTGGRDSRVFRSAVGAADLLIVPVLPSVYDVWAAGDTLDLVREVHSFGIQTPTRLLLNQVIAGTVMGREADEALAEHSDIAPVMEARIHHRQVFKNAATTGKGVVEVEPKGKAAAEIEALLSEILEINETNMAKAQ